MKEYQVKGLTCANCARALEEQIQSLPYGEGATLSYNSGKLRVHERIDLEKVRAILATDGAYIADDEQTQKKTKSAPLSRRCLSCSFFDGACA